MRVDRDVLALGDYIIAKRRWLHQNPEIGFKVLKTRDYILKELESLEFDSIEILADTGIKALMKGKKGDRTLAFRADMDALLIDDGTGLEFSSLNPGAMHACGHDGHMAILLGLAKWVSLNRGGILDNILLVFQPDEENEGGALPMIEEGLLKSPEVDAIFGAHIMPEIPQGKIGIKAGPVMAQTSEVNIEIIGKPAHGAMPHRGVDPIVGAAHFINALQAIISRTIDPRDEAIFTIGKIYGGDTRNILASKVTLECTVRTFKEELYKDIKEKVKNLLSGMELSHGIKWEYKENVYYPPVINHKDLTDRVMKILPKDNYIEAKPLMIAEDFSNYQKRVPGVFMFLGSKNPDKGYINPLHSDKFDFDEEILMYGVQLYKDIILKI